MAGADGRYVEASLAADTKGLVVEGMGRGNLTPGLAEAIKAVADEIPVIMTTRCIRGRAAPMYGYDGGGAITSRHGWAVPDPQSLPSRPFPWGRHSCVFRCASARSETWI